MCAKQKARQPSNSARKDAFLRKVRDLIRKQHKTKKQSRR